MARIVTIVVAGGSGQRMAGGRAKQFMELNGVPILMHTLRNYRAALDALPEALDVVNEMVVVLPGGCMDLWRELCVDFGFEVEHTVVEGGATRFESVLRGLQYVEREVNPSPCLISVHDGVRPFVERSTLERAIKSAIVVGSGVACTEVVDSVRLIESNGENHPLERAMLRAVQTPQVFRYTVIIDSYRQPYQSVFTDDSSVCQMAGHPIRLVQSSLNNIKITTPKDMALAQYILSDFDPAK